MLHPRHKLEYFKTAGWEDGWIKTAEQAVRDRFDSDYDFKEQDIGQEIVYSSERDEPVRERVVFISFIALNVNLGRRAVGKYIR